MPRREHGSKNRVSAGSDQDEHGFGPGSGCGVAIFDADAPSVRGLVWVAVMGVCLWFENPIACLFELVVMPEIVCFSGETIYWASFDHPRGRVGCLAGIHSAT